MQWLWGDLAQDSSQKPNLPPNLSLRPGPALGIHSELRALSKHNNQSDAAGCLIYMGAVKLVRIPLGNNKSWVCKFCTQESRRDSNGPREKQRKHRWHL